jgi:hypothetical protein
MELDLSHLGLAGAFPPALLDGSLPRLRSLSLNGNR